VLASDEDTLISGNVLGNDTDANKDTLSVTPASFTTAQGGVVVLLANGDFTYTPVANYYGADSFSYTISDGKGGSASATVNLSIASVNDGPVAQNDDVSGMTGNAVSGNVLGNDSDVEGDALSVVAATFDTAHGHVVLLANGNFTYLAASGFVGMDSFEYTLLDGHGGIMTGSVSLSILTNIINGAAESEVMDATVLNDIIYGGDGADTINAGTGDDTVYGGLHNDTINGGDGNDTLFGEASNDILHGDAGIDTLSGGDGNDYLYGDADTDTLSGGAGIDYLYGGAGNDIIGGDDGDDSMYGGDGDDGMNGGLGNDIITGELGNDTLGGGDGDDKLYGGEGDDTVHGDFGIDTVYGGLGNDSLYGDAGDDVLSGDAGNDNLYGGAGKDTVFGGLGDDTLYGGAGEDMLWGQGGADTFKFTTEDMDGSINRIRDFKTGDHDVIDITDILFGYQQGSSAIADFVRFDAPAANGDISVAVDRDGAGTAYNWQYIAKVYNPGETLDAQSLFDTGQLVVI
jgi:Ca2+-binding RTX toxin-like protein